MRDAEYVVHPWEVGGQPRSQHKLLQTHLELNVPWNEECRHVSEESETRSDVWKQNATLTKPKSTNSPEVKFAQNM